MADGADDEELPNEAHVRLVAAMVLRAGMTMLAGGDTRALPARGYLPPPATGSPEVEYGAALAVRALIATFGLDESDVGRLADSLAS